MSIQFRASVAVIAAFSTVSTESTLTGTSVETLIPLIISSHSQPAQIGWSPHLAALVGILALALLGGVLAARNRFDEQDTLVAESEPRSEEFLTDRERVQQLVRENGGRMKQSRIVDSVDWSKAKVSRLLAELEEEGRVTKLRLGRENLVCLPGHEPTASQSPEKPKSE